MDSGAAGVVIVIIVLWLRHMIDLLVLDDQNLKSLATRKDITSEFPFFQTLATAASAGNAGGCGRCGGKSQIWAAYNEVKRALHELPAEKKARFKSLVGAKQVRLRFVDRRNVLVKLTF